MLASVGSELPAGTGWTFEPKYDGIRILAFAAPSGVALRTRNGADKARQFPEIVDALAQLVRRRRHAFVLDGEIVARHGDGLGRFQGLQERMHQRDPTVVARHATDEPAVLVALDLLSSGRRSLVERAWTERRQALEALLDGATAAVGGEEKGRVTGEVVLLGESHPGDGVRLMKRARRERWEGVVAKRMDAPYVPGRRVSHWLKIKIEGRQELVVGGWTEPRNSRQHIGALLLGYFDDAGRLIYAGHTGGGFTRAALEEMFERLAPLERKRSPFAVTPRPNARPHWTRPVVVVEVKFNEWTDGGRLRQPIFLGVRDDKDPRDVRREAPSTHAPTPVSKKVAPTAKRVQRAAPAIARSGVLGKRIAAIERAGGDGTLAVAPGRSIELSSLDKPFFPKAGYTKGDLMAYYAAVAPALLPQIAGRPLVLRRFPDGTAGEPFYQQNAPPNAPSSVKVAAVAVEGRGTSMRLIGGDLATLLYCVQLGCVEVHPWHSRLGSLDDADYAILDLDPGPRASFSRVVQVARWLHEEMERVGVHGALKTSGSEGLHIYIPLPAHASYESSRLFAEVIATRVASAHPREATVVRAVRGRARDAVYVDFLQNVEGKSVAAPFSVRPHEPGRVSTPLSWSELTDTLDPADFTMASVMKEVKTRRALWTAGMRRRNSLRSLRLLDTK